MIQEKNIAKKVDASYRFNININGGQTVKKWTIDLKQNPPFVGECSNTKVDAEFTIKDEDFMKLAAGKLRADQVSLFNQMLQFFLTFYVYNFYKTLYYQIINYLLTFRLLCKAK